MLVAGSRKGKTVEPAWHDIAAMEDPVRRNLWITQRYHELAVALRDCGAGANATWCTFAVWASKTAGSVIRGEDLPGAIRSLVADRAAGPIDRFNRDAFRFAHLSGPLGEEHLARFADKITADVAGHIAEGNALVFGELAPPFEALVDSWASGPDAAFAAALAALPAGPEGSPLSGAFDTYRRALTSPDQASLILAGNVMAVAHEQERLQPAITSALDAAVRETLHQVIEEDIANHLPGPARWLLDRVVDELARILEPICRVAITEMMLRLVTADEQLDLCSDLPPLDGVMWPPELAVLGSGLAAFFEWDRTRGTGRPTGASDWSVLEERMNYIVNLFRSRQRHPALLDPPFSAGQLAELRAGRLPAGPL